MHKHKRMLLYSVSVKFPYTSPLANSAEGYALQCFFIYIVFMYYNSFVCISQASSSASSGDMVTAKQYNSGSLACTVVSMVSAILPFIFLIIWIAVAASSGS